MNIKHDKEKVLHQGLELFWYKGYHNLGVEEICKTTGMTKGAFYNAFKSKENFLLSCIDSYEIMNVSYLTEHLAEEHKNAIDNLLNMYITMLKKQPKDNFSGCMINNIMSEIGSLNNVIGNATAKAFESLLDVIVPAVQKAQKEGDISPCLDPKEVTDLIHSTFFGVLTRAKSTRDDQKAISTMTLLIKSLKTI
jgi:TetR/AcrR family transcriptional repressor of nem operon